MEHVKAGEAIRASTINEIIDGLGGQFSSDGSFLTTGKGVVLKDNSWYDVASGYSANPWNVDQYTLVVRNAYVQLGDKTLGAKLTEAEYELDGKTVKDYYHLIDFGKKALEDEDFEGDYYIRIENSIIDDPESAQSQESEGEFDDLYTDNEDEENPIGHYKGIQVVKDDVKNGEDSAFDDETQPNPDDCTFFRFFTIHGPTEAEKSAGSGDPAFTGKASAPYRITYYQRGIGSGTSGSKTTLRPFALRWQRTSKTDENAGEWQIYLPMGCVSVNGEPSTPSNDTGSDMEGDLTYQWYKIPDPEDGDADIETRGSFAYKQWTVNVLVKPYPLFKATTKREDSEFGGYDDIVSVGSLMQKTWTDDDGKQHVDHKTTQTRTESYRHEFENSGSFRIIFENEGDRKNPSSWKIKLTNQYIDVGREQIWIDSDTDITDMEDVVLVIDHSEIDMSIDIQDAMESSTMDKTYVKILKMDEGAIADDLRSEARRTFPFYNS